ncbi:MAG: hypothetical protein KDC26_05840 [Armatimonadetes bacterium]|nr:hypothetical protein [Armatimonadota bacterium]
MISAVILASSILKPAQASEFLYRDFKKGDQLKYEVRSYMIDEIAEYPVITAIPQRIDLNYDFTMKVIDVKNGGFAVAEYRRPTMIQIDGETAESAPVKHVEKVDMNFKMDLSPINEITNVEDLPKDKSTGKGLPLPGGYQVKWDSALQQLRATSPEAYASLQALDISQFIGELQRMVLFIGSLDSAIDFNPKLPLDEVEVGDTWKKTVSYQPQNKTGKGGEIINQRLDMTYKYEGIKEVEGVKVHRITASVELDTDIAKFINDLLGASPSQTGLSKMPMKLNSNLEFDLDLKSKATLYAEGKSNASWSIEVPQLPGRAVVSSKMTGKVVMQKK